MFIQHITIEHFGSILSHETVLNRELNLIGSHHNPEIAAAIAFLMCSAASQTVPEEWVWENTLLSAKVNLDNTFYTVCATPRMGRLQLSVVDPSGADVTDFYRHALCHCPEQDAIEAFDGNDKTIPYRLCSYRDPEDQNDLSRRTGRLADTKTFRRHLFQYIRVFRPEPINSKKNYQTAIHPQGKFEVFYPGVSGAVSLSETEEKLFLYICFLNIAEFWEEIEQIRDLHHEKKPLLIRNFAEFLDKSANIKGLIVRTQKLARQIIILTNPLSKEEKEKWTGNNNG